MRDMFIKLTGKTMGNSNNGGSGSDRIKSDRGGSIGKPMGDAQTGQSPTPSTSSLPPLKKPKK